MADVLPEVFDRLDQIEKRLAELEGKTGTTAPAPTTGTAPALSSTATPPFDNASGTK